MDLISFCLAEGYLLHVGDETVRIPGSERIIGLDSGSNDFIFIRTEFNLFKYQSSGTLTRIHLITRDRILAVFDEGDKLWVVQARGTVQLFTSLSNEFKYLKSFSLSEFSAVFYSASIIRKMDTIEIAYGTIFSGILIARIVDGQSDNKIYSIGTINGHCGTIFDIKHHPKDSNVLISCSDDRSIRIWKRNTEKNMFESSAIFNGHEARVWSIDVKGNVIASVSEDNTCRIWDLKGSGIIKIIEGNSNSKSIWSVALNDNAYNVTIGSNDGSVASHSLKFYDNPSELIEFSLSESLGSIKNLVISNDGICYVATDKDKVIKILGDSIFEIKGINKFPAMAINSNYLFIADDGGSVFCHELKSEGFTFEKLLTLDTNITKIHAQGDDILFLETVNCEYYLFRILKKGIERILIDKNHKITSFCQLKEDVILIGTRQGILLTFQSGSLTKSLQLTQQESLKSIKIISDNQISVLDRSGYEIILDINDLSVLNRIKIGKGVLEGHINYNLISSFYQQYFMVNSSIFGVVNKISCGGGHRLWSAAADSKSVHFAFMSNGKLTIRHESLEKVKIISSKSHGKEIRCSHNLNYNNLVISGSEDGLLVLYEGLNYRNEIRLRNTSVKCIASVDDLVFVGGSNETIEAFKLNKTFILTHLANCPKQIKSIETRVLCLDAKKFNDKILILAGYSDASIRAFEYQNESFKVKGKIEKVHQNRCVQQIRFLPSDEEFKFISAGADGLIQSWTLKEQEKDDTFELSWHCSVHQSGINAIDIKSFEDSSVYILTGGEDGSISLLNILNDEIKSLKTKNVHNSTVTGVKFLKTGASFISASIDRYIYLHDNNPKGFRTVISDISAISLTSDTDNNLFVYGAGIEAFKL